MTNFSIVMSVIGVAAIVGVWCFISTYNKLVRTKNMKEEGWSGVEVQLKRRHDLIPNLVNTISGYMTHEKETLVGVTQARALGKEAKTLSEVNAAEGMLSQALGRLFSVVENYPELKANTNILQLQEELIKVEDNIQLSRRYYNATVRDLNTLRETFPSNIVAGMFGFAKGVFFELDSQADKENPVVKF
jgi:LemA protein